MKVENMTDSSLSAPMYSLSLKIPDSLAHLDDAQAMELASLAGEEIISASCERGKDDQIGHYWEFLWVTEILPGKENFINSINEFLGLSGPQALQPHDLIEKEIEDVNWLEESYKSFPPFEIGPFFIHGSHYTGEIPPSMIPLLIDAATAFGSGEHGTTRGCLEALIALKESGFAPREVLDMGTGSGILAIAAHKLWGVPVVAIDIDDEATRMARHHCDVNQVACDAGGVDCITGDGYRAQILKNADGRNRKFDMIIANILAGPLVDMAPDLAQFLSQNGRAILSGLLIEQEEIVAAAHAKLGLICSTGVTDFPPSKFPPSKFPRGEWQTLVLRWQSQA